MKKAIICSQQMYFFTLLSYILIIYTYLNTGDLDKITAFEIISFDVVSCDFKFIHDMSTK